MGFRVRVRDSERRGCERRGARGVSRETKYAMRAAEVAVERPDLFLYLLESTGGGGGAFGLC